MIREQAMLGPQHNTYLPSAYMNPAAGVKDALPARTLCLACCVWLQWDDWRRWC